MSADSVLVALREIAGVEGALVATRSGNVLVQSMSPIFGDEMLVAAARRFGTLTDTIDENFEPSDEIVLGYSGFSLVLRLRGPLVLAVLTQPRPNLEALRMASTVALRRIEAELAPASVIPASSTAPRIEAPSTQPRMAAPKAAPPRPTASVPAVAQAPKKKPSIWD